MRAPRCVPVDRADTVALHGKGGLVPLLEKVGVKVAA